jgi:hypothetical protein
MEGMMRQVLAIAAAAVGLALLGSLTCTGCAIGRDHAASAEAIQLMASHSAQPDRLFVDGLGMSLMDNASTNEGTSSAQSYRACWFDFDLPQCE